MARHGESVVRRVVQHTTLYFLFVLLVSAFGPFQFGFHLAELNAPQAVITCEKKSIASTANDSKMPQCIPMNTDQFAVVSSIYTLGGFIGAVVAGPLCSRYGRKLTMLGKTIFFIIGPGFEASAATTEMLSFGRLLSGIGAGAAIVVVPIYISEISPPEFKGLFGATTQIMINFGILLAQLLGYFLSRGQLWRIILAVAGAISLVHFAALLLVPESPKWLAEHQRLHQTRQVLKKLRTKGAALEEEIKSWAIHGSAEDSEEESLLAPHSGNYNSKNPTKGVSIIKAMTDPLHRPAVIAVMAAMATQQLTGINSIIMYSVSTLSSILPTTAALLTVFISVLNIIVTTACAPLSDVFGRKTCILASAAGMGLSSLLLAAGMGNGIKALAAIASLLFVASFAVGLGPVPFTLASELVDQEAVGATQSWAMASNWIATFIVSQFFPILNKAMGEKGRVYFVFAGLALVLGLFIAWWVPESKGKKNADEVWGRKDSRERLE